MRLHDIQLALREEGIDGWLLYDFRAREPLAYKVLGLDLKPLASRRWYYFIPARGTPVKITSRVEPRRLESLDGRTAHYTTWEELRSVLRRMLGRSRRKIAMQYSPRSLLPYISTADAGTVELIRSLGHSVVSSKDLLTLAVGVMTPTALAELQRTAEVMDGIRRKVFGRISTALDSGKRLTEYEAQQWIVEQFQKKGLITYAPPMVGVGPHPADPHFETAEVGSAPIRKGQPLLLDFWAKNAGIGAIYFDSTWVAFSGPKPPPLYRKIFRIVRDARDAAIELLHRRFESGRPIRGFEVDRAARAVIDRAGYGRYFIHRTGHSITTELHGEGVNMDDFETHDDRRIMPLSCFSIEPGIYLPKKFGVRSENTVAVTARGKVVVLGELQREITLL